MTEGLRCLEALQGAAAALLCRTSVGSRQKGMCVYLGACSAWVMQKLSKAWGLGMEMERCGRQGTGTAVVSCGDGEVGQGVALDRNRLLLERMDCRGGRC